MAEICNILFQPLDRPSQARNESFIREPRREAMLIVGHGIEGDAKAGHHPDRQLNLLSREWLERVERLGYQITPGSFGEQLIVEGVDFEELGPGVRLKLGPEACIEITKPRTGCSRLEAAQERSVEAIGGEIGLMAKVLVGGRIAEGDSVRALDADEPC